MCLIWKLSNVPKLKFRINLLRNTHVSRVKLCRISAAQHDQRTERSTPCYPEQAAQIARKEFLTGTESKLIPANNTEGSNTSVSHCRISTELGSIPVFPGARGGRVGRVPAGRWQHSGHSGDTRSPGGEDTAAQPRLQHRQANGAAFSRTDNRNCQKGTGDKTIL